MCDTDIVSPEEGESQVFQWFSYDELETFTKIPPAIRQCAQYAINYIQEINS